MAEAFVALFRVDSRTFIPSPPVPGTAYFVADEGKILLYRSSGVYEEFGGSGDGGAGVINSLNGNQVDQAPSVHATKVALFTKADLIDGKVDPAQLPVMYLVYRGVFVGADLSAAFNAVSAAHPADVLGAYATLVVSNTPYLYVWGGTYWEATGLSGVWVESINGQSGPVVNLTAADLGAVSSLDLSGKEDKTNKGIDDGYVPLGSDGKIPESFLPAIVDGGVVI